jgi:hypothetical protein
MVLMFVRNQASGQAAELVAGLFLELSHRKPGFQKKPGCSV